MKILKNIGWTLAGLLVLIQFIPVTYPETAESEEYDLFTTTTVPDEVGSIIKNACYDCHSSQTRYPWYSYIAPAKWLIVQDVNKGRKELNFSGWDSLNIRNKIKLLDEIAEEVEEGNMPLPIYTLLHPDGSLNEEERKTLIDWTGQTMNDVLGD
jgi:hypothetical protein